MSRKLNLFRFKKSLYRYSFFLGLFLLAFLVVLIPLAPAQGKGDWGLGTGNFQFPVSSKLSSLTADSQPSSWLQQGIEFYQKERFSESTQILQQAIAAFQGDDWQRGTALNYLSLAYQKLGQRSQASEAVETSLKFLQTLGENSSTLPIIAQALPLKNI